LLDFVPTVPILRTVCVSLRDVVDCFMCYCLTVYVACCVICWICYGYAMRAYCLVVCRSALLK